MRRRDLPDKNNEEAKCYTARMRLVLFLFIIYFQAEAIVDLNISFTSSVQKVDGIESPGSTEDPGEAVATTEGFNVILAWYVFTYTAVELNYSQNTERLEDDRVSSTGGSSGTISVNKIESVVRTKVQGIGLRQALASRKSRIIPSIAVGYAQLTTTGETTYTLSDSGVTDELTILSDEETQNSGYVSFVLRFRITELMGLTLMARSVMPDFDSSQADQNLFYSAGISWIF